MTELNVIDIIEGTTVDGPGLRTSIYFAGCEHHCFGCHNPQSWDSHAGKPMTIDDIMRVVEYNDFNVTFSGGDPLFQAEGVAELAQRIKKQLGKSIWCYTGYRWEDVVHKLRYQPLLQSIDVLVDGPFKLELRDISLRFRGSANQRLIDVQKSLRSNVPVLYE
ncbi:MAG: anaerobic ribonucleoside-triphosphate reductase activating protein [Muribaculaceae bacterium]